MTKKRRKKVKRSVAVFLIIIEDGNVVLLRRSPTQSNAGVLQPSANGKLEGNEDWLEALDREIREELGEKLAETLDVSDFSLIHEESYTYRGTYICRSYLGFITWDQIDLIELSEESDKIVVFMPEDVNKIKTTEEVKDTGFDPDEDMVMFVDQLKALKKIFQ